MGYEGHALALSQPGQPNGEYSAEARRCKGQARRLPAQNRYRLLASTGFSPPGMGAGRQAGIEPLRAEIGRKRGTVRYTPSLG